MKLTGILALTALSLNLVTTPIIAQEHHDDHPDHSYVRHDEWKKGGRIEQQDWNRGAKVDYRQHHLNAPPRGYEWRQVDGNYVLAAAATGIIASAIVASSVH